MLDARDGEINCQTLSYLIPTMDLVIETRKNRLLPRMRFDSGLSPFLVSSLLLRAICLTWCRRQCHNTPSHLGKGVMTVTDRIEVNPRVMLGKPVIRGTRVPVELILRKLSEGATEDDLLDAYPRLSRQDIQAAIGYAADTLAHEETLIVTPRKTRTNR